MSRERGGVECCRKGRGEWKLNKERGGKWEET